MLSVSGHELSDDLSIQVAGLTFNIKLPILCNNLLMPGLSIQLHLISQGWDNLKNISGETAGSVTFAPANEMPAS